MLLIKNANLFDNIVDILCFKNTIVEIGSINYKLLKESFQNHKLEIIDANNMKNSVTVSPKNDDLKGVRYTDSVKSYEEYDLFFDVLCNSFSVTSNYAGVSDQIKKSF